MQLVELHALFVYWHLHLGIQVPTVAGGYISSIPSALKYSYVEL